MEGYGGSRDEIVSGGSSEKKTVTFSIFSHPCHKKSKIRAIITSLCPAVWQPILEPHVNQLTSYLAIYLPCLPTPTYLPLYLTQLAPACQFASKTSSNRIHPCDFLEYSGRKATTSTSLLSFPAANLQASRTNPKADVIAIKARELQLRKLLSTYILPTLPQLPTDTLLRITSYHPNTSVDLKVAHITSAQQQILSHFLPNRPSSPTYTTSP
jgi:hypothetical protein